MHDDPPALSAEEARRILVLFEHLRDLPEGERQRHLDSQALRSSSRRRLERMLRLVDEDTESLEQLR